MSDTYEVIAIEYARQVRESRQYYIFPDPHDGPRPIAFYLWVLRNRERTIVVDTGFGQEAAARRGRELLRHPVDALGALGIRAGDTRDVILTHMHFDHAGTAPDFPNAEFILQEREIAFATGRPMRYPACRMPFDVENVVDVVKANFASRVRFVDGDAQVAPGVSVHLVGGHSGGLQAVRVQTEAGPLVLASDAAHFYDTVSLHNPHPVVANMVDVCRAYERIFELGAEPARVIPGHDPAVADIYPAHADDPRAFVLTGKPLSTPPWAG